MFFPFIFLNFLSSEARDYSCRFLFTLFRLVIEVAASFHSSLSELFFALFTTVRPSSLPALPSLFSLYTLSHYSLLAPFTFFALFTSFTVIMLICSFALSLSPFASRVHARSLPQGQPTKTGKQKTKTTVKKLLRRTCPT
jgi:hypothetical protein